MTQPPLRLNNSDTHDWYTREVTMGLDSYYAGGINWPVSSTDIFTAEDADTIYRCGPPRTANGQLCDTVFNQDDVLRACPSATTTRARVLRLGAVFGAASSSWGIPDNPGELKAVIAKLTYRLWFTAEPEHYPHGWVYRPGEQLRTNPPLTDDPYDGSCVIPQDRGLIVVVAPWKASWHFNHRYNSYELLVAGAFTTVPASCCYQQQ